MRQRNVVAFALSLGLVAGVAHAANTTTASKPTASKASAANASTAKPSTAKWNPVVPFIEDDFGRALALAKERKLPVFIEGWAPW